MWKIQVIINGFRYMDDFDSIVRRLFKSHGTECRVVTANSDQPVNTQFQQRIDDIIEMLFIFGGIIPRDADDRTTTEVDTADFINS